MLKIRKNYPLHLNPLKHDGTKIAYENPNATIAARRESKKQ